MQCIKLQSAGSYSSENDGKVVVVYSCHLLMQEQVNVLARQSHKRGNLIINSFADLDNEMLSQVEQDGQMVVFYSYHVLSTLKYKSADTI